MVHATSLNISNYCAVCTPAVYYWYHGASPPARSVTRDGCVNEAARYALSVHIRFASAAKP
eukprot:6208056-Pleurochrysis_carterae.AAC.1